MRELLISDEHAAAAAGLCVSDSDVERLGRRFERKVQRFLEAVPLPAKGLTRRRIAHANVVHVHSAHDVRQGVSYTHGVAVLRLAKMPHRFPELSEPFDLESTLHMAGDRPANATSDPDLRAAAEHLQQQTLSYLREQGQRVMPAGPLEPGWRADVQIDALNFFDATAERITLVTHVLIELAAAHDFAVMR